MMTCVLAPLYTGVCRALLILRVALSFMRFSVIGMTFLVILLLTTVVEVIILIVLSIASLFVMIVLIFVIFLFEVTAGSWIDV